MLEANMTRLRIDLGTPRSRRFGNPLNRLGVGLLLSLGVMCGCGEKGRKQEAPVAISLSEPPVEKALAPVPPASDRVAMSETVPEPAPVQTADLEELNEGLKKVLSYPPEESFELYDQGVRLLKGEGVEKNTKEAERLFRESAQLGNPLAEHNLGVMYLTGIGMEKNTATAVEWIRKAGDRGLAEAQFKLAGFYATGLGVEENVKESAAWLKKAAAQGHVEAAYNLATFYAGEKNEESNYVEAAKWYRIAAEHGKVSAQSNLGVLYGRGLGVAQDFVEAVKWFRKAAERGHRSAQFNLARSYIEGKALEPDKVEAYKWYSLSAAQGDPDAERERLELSIEMSPAEMGEAIRRATEFTARIESERPNVGGLIPGALR
ncbi:MAG: tetratricopeptide repeat protein [Verrucomicrobia bacterium]|nr:tetratricopeptide repeat protein [Verrucomicrobiota bacterium]